MNTPRIADWARPLVSLLLRFGLVSPNPSLGNPLYDWNHLIGLPGSRTRIAALTVVVPMSKRC
jgi:hypothetical protein